MELNLLKLFVYVLGGLGLAISVLGIITLIIS